VTSERRQVVDLTAGAGAERLAGEPPADVEIDVSASAAEVRALERSRTGTTVTGSEGARRSDVAWRRNLPSRLEPGAVYKDTKIRRRVMGYLVADRRLNR
jgi:hypothetical protein